IFKYSSPDSSRLDVAAKFIFQSSRYVVPIGRVVVPTGRYVVPAGKVIIIVSTGRIILFIVDSGCSKHMTGNLKLLSNFVEKFLGTVKFRNDQIAPILGYGDLVQGNITIKRVYYVEWLNHNSFSVGQLCDADLEVAFRKSFHIKTTPSSKRRLQLLHMDLCGPM
ncbi:hypothetical protein Tco_1496356, partial [Tanacetum coccineum]